jgi:hypothetical protein
MSTTLEESGGTRATLVQSRANLDDGGLAMTFRKRRNQSLSQVGHEKELHEGQRDLRPLQPRHRESGHSTFDIQDFMLQI